MKNFLQNNKIILSFALFAAVIGNAVYWLIMPLLSQINVNSDKIQEVLARQENRSRKLSDLPHLRYQFEMIEKNKDHMVKVLERNQAVEFIKLLEKIASETGNQIDIQVEEDKQTNPKRGRGKKEEENKGLEANLPAENFLTFNISLEGSFISMMGFLQKIENMEYHSDILSINAALSQTDDQNNLAIGAARSDQKATNEAEVIKKDNKIATNIKLIVYLNK